MSDPSLEESGRKRHRRSSSWINTIEQNGDEGWQRPALSKEDCVRRRRLRRKARKRDPWQGGCQGRGKAWLIDVSNGWEWIYGRWTRCLYPLDDACRSHYIGKLPHLYSIRSKAFQGTAWVVEAASDIARGAKPHLRAPFPQIIYHTRTSLSGDFFCQDGPLAFHPAPKDSKGRLSEG